MARPTSEPRGVRLLLIAVALAFLAGVYLLVKRKVPRFARALLGLYDLNALLGLLYLAFAGKVLPHPLLALFGVALLHALIKRPHPWPGIGFFLLGLLLLWH